MVVTADLGHQATGQMHRRRKKQHEESHQQSDLPCDGTDHGDAAGWPSNLAMDRKDEAREILR